MAEHLTTHNNKVTINPGLAVSFVAPDALADGPQFASLGDAPIDGFEKTVIYAGGLPGLALYVEGPSLTRVSIADGGGCAALVWNAHAHAWAVKSLLNATKV